LILSAELGTSFSMVRDGRERLLKVEDMEATCESRQGELNVHFMDFCFQVTLKKNLNLA